MLPNWEVGGCVMNRKGSILVEGMFLFIRVVLICVLISEIFSSNFKLQTHLNEVQEVVEQFEE